MSHHTAFMLLFLVPEVEPRACCMLDKYSNWTMPLVRELLFPSTYLFCMCVYGGSSATVQEPWPRTTYGNSLSLSFLGDWTPIFSLDGKQFFPSIESSCLSLNLFLTGVWADSGRQMNKFSINNAFSTFTKQLQKVDRLACVTYLLFVHLAFAGPQRGHVIGLICHTPYWVLSLNTKAITIGSQWLLASLPIAPLSS